MTRFIKFALVFLLGIAVAIPMSALAGGGAQVTTSTDPDGSLIVMAEGTIKSVTVNGVVVYTMKQDASVKTGALRGSCTVAGRQYNLVVDPWHPRGNRLYMPDDLLAAGRGTNGTVPCHFYTPSMATLEIATGNRDVSAGHEEYPVVTGGPSFGFAVQTRK